jgi:hypothetical protein
MADGVDMGDGDDMVGEVDETPCCENCKMWRLPQWDTQGYGTC